MQSLAPRRLRFQRLRTSNASSTLPDDDPADRAELERLLTKHDLWLGYSPSKGWVRLDRKHPSHSDWHRPFVMLGDDGSVDRLVRGVQPGTQWSMVVEVLETDRRRDATGSRASLRSAAGNTLRYIEKAELAARHQGQDRGDGNEDFSTRIGDPPSTRISISLSGLELQEKWIAAKREHYASALPIRVHWLRGWARKLCDGATGLEPTWSRGSGAACHLSDHGITHLWHFTDIRNLPVFVAKVACIAGRA